MRGAGRSIGGVSGSMGHRCCPAGGLKIALSGLGGDAGKAHPSGLE